MARPAAWRPLDLWKFHPPPSEPMEGRTDCLTSVFVCVYVCVHVHLWYVISPLLADSMEPSKTKERLGSGRVSSYGQKNNSQHVTCYSKTLSCLALNTFIFIIYVKTQRSKARQGWGYSPALALAVSSSYLSFGNFNLEQCNRAIYFMTIRWWQAPLLICSGVHDSYVLSRFFFKPGGD